MRTEAWIVALGVELPHVVVVLVGHAETQSGSHLGNLELAAYGIVGNLVLVYVSERIVGVFYPFRSVPSCAHESGFEVSLLCRGGFVAFVVGHCHLPIVAR